MTRSRWRPYLVCIVALALPSLACGGKKPEIAATEQVAQAPDSAAEQATPSEPAPDELLRNGKRLDNGTLVGGQPTPEQLERLAQLGYTTIINLRAADEDGTTEEQVRQLGMSFVPIPITSADDLSEENARALAEALNGSAGPAVVHCASGNRVGALFAFKAFYVDGLAADDAIAFGKQSGMTRLESVVSEKLNQAE